MNNVKVLERDGFSAHLDEATGVTYVTYPEYLTPDITREMYQWLLGVSDTIGFENLHGCVFDFTHVTKFHPGNISAARSKSRAINQAVDLSHLPVAFIVKDMQQEQMLRVSMRLTEHPERLRIFHSMAEGCQFIKQFRNQK